MCSIYLLLLNSGPINKFREKLEKKQFWYTTILAHLGEENDIPNLVFNFLKLEGPEHL